MRTWLALSTLLLAGCVPDVDIDPSHVDAPRLVAVRADPAEAPPGARVTLTALYVSSDGELAEAELDWAACLARLPLAEPGPIARACIAGDPDALAPLGIGTSSPLTLSTDACRLFGPDPPPSTPGQPNGRPVDPDSTGGYAQPLRIALPDGSLALASVRLSCGVAGATQDQSAEMRRRSHANQTPVITTLLAGHEDGSAQELFDGVPLRVAPGETIVLSARWPECPLADTCGDAVCGADEDRTACADDCATPVGCEGAERYVRFDTGAHTIVVARESLRVSWLATFGDFAEPRTGRASDDLATATDDVWTAPDAGHGWIWAVLRDDRGGTSWRSVEVVVD
jgi:hypothetical protein